MQNLCVFIVYRSSKTIESDFMPQNKRKSSTFSVSDLREKSIGDFWIIVKNDQVNQLKKIQSKFCAGHTFQPNWPV